MTNKLFLVLALLNIILFAHAIKASNDIDVYLQNNYGSAVEYAYNILKEYPDIFPSERIEDNQQKKIGTISRFSDSNKLHFRRPNGVYHTRDVNAQILKERADNPNQDVVIVINPRGWFGALKSWDITLNWIKKRV